MTGFGRSGRRHRIRADFRGRVTELDLVSCIGNPFVRDLGEPAFDLIELARRTSATWASHLPMSSGKNLS